MPSFDVVSEVDKHELTNAIDQLNREVSTRYDFKGSNARAEQKDGAILLEAENELQIKQMLDLLYQKAAKRGIDVGHLAPGAIEPSGQRVRQAVSVRQGIDKDAAKRIIKLIKDSKLKVQAASQGEQVRISGKKRDDLQQVIAMLRTSDSDRPLQYVNFRD